MTWPFASPAEVDELLDRHDYLAGDGVATVVFLCARLGRPLFVEGDPGVGKTELARVLARGLGVPLVRLQCYEGIDASQALYEWDHARQLLHLRATEGRATAASGDTPEAEVYDRRFLIERPLLRALTLASATAPGAPPPVLLIDELDRADDEFEAFLLELLGDFQVTVPEIGTIRARRRPAVVITSNRTREIHDALRRRCLYHWIDYPDAAKEYQIVRAKVPEAAEHLSRQVVEFVQALRREDLYKRPGVAETLDWVHALVSLDRHVLTVETVESTLGALLKYQDDIERVRAGFIARALGSPSPG